MPTWVDDELLAMWLVPLACAFVLMVYPISDYNGTRWGVETFKV